MRSWLLFKDVVFSVVLFGAFFSSSAWAFPELTRHGYTSCTACHVSPSGGGTLTKYGRELSREILSTWGYEGEQGFLHGWINDSTEEPILLPGGDLRLIQLYQDNAQVRSARLFLMQADLELAFRPGKWTFDATLGRVLRGADAYFGSHRFFAAYAFSESFSMRAGQYFPFFGLLIPDHFVGTRRGLGFDEGQETRNLEFNWADENWNAVLTASLPQDDTRARAQQRRGTGMLQVTRALGTMSRVGGSLMAGGLDGDSYRALALHGIWGFNPELVLLAELDWKWIHQELLNTSTATDYRYLKLAYEITKGLSPYLVHDGGKTQNAWGIGLQWFPRPHFELSGAIEKVFSTRSQDGGDLFSWLLLHYYL